MSQVLDDPKVEYRTEQPAPVRRRGHIIDYTLMVIGALVAVVGAYFQFAPDGWWLAHFTEGYAFGGYVLGGALLSTGLAVYADRATEEDGHQSGRVRTAIALAALAAIGAVIAAVVWVL